MKNCTVFFTRRRTATAGLMIAAAALILAGILAGEPLDVMQKAVNICLECIGIG